jgi:hypothetical protein
MRPRQADGAVQKVQELQEHLFCANRFCVELR